MTTSTSALRRTRDPHIVLMVGLTALFAVRVFAQFIQVIAPIPVLPAFSFWQSDTLPYSFLFVSQLVILMVMAWLCRRCIAAPLRVSERSRRALRTIALCYLAAMVLRLVIGQFFLPEHAWYSAVLPTLFHIVLAGFLLSFVARLEPRALWVNAVKRVAPTLVFPLLVGTGILLHFRLVDASHALLVSTVFPVLICVSIIVLLERIMPARDAWQWQVTDAKTDIAYLALVQQLLPKLLAGLFVIVGIAGHGSGVQITGLPLWPHSWPVGWQVVLMVLVADFFRYWLHRAAHTYRILWRFHAVHHAPDKLYALNVGRFHPVDKALQFLLDALPFLLLGVSANVLALYFVFYAINGFLQHCNIDVRYGWLNYVISGPELHRWHHSRHAGESGHNLGNNLSVWDLVFGTWFLPSEGRVEQLGLSDRRYPHGFVGQMLAPFAAWSGSGVKFGHRIRRAVGNAIVHVVLRAAYFRYVKPYLKATHDPRGAQAQLLERIIRDNADTVFGRHHRFAAMQRPQDYFERVPIMYDRDIATWLGKHDQLGSGCLTGAPIASYARTSGTTGKAKDIPLTELTLNTLKRQHIASVALQRAYCPAAFSGDILAVTSPAKEGNAADGKPFGAVSGQVLDSTPRWLGNKLIVPTEVFDLQDASLRQLLIVRLALDSDKLTYLGTANPSTLLALLDTLEEHAATLIEDVEHGRFHRFDELPSALRSQLKQRLIANPNRASELRAIVGTGQPLDYRNVWPSLQLVVTWRNAGGGLAAKALEDKLPTHTRTMELGYIASEFRGTLTVAGDTGLPTLLDTVFEFIERAAFESGERQTLTIDQLTHGCEYYVLITTRSGLYRYFINDIVRVTGSIGQSPVLAFVQKGSGVTNITGEKLYESHVVKALAGLARDCGLKPRYAVLIADRTTSDYTLYFETDRVLNVSPARIAERFDGLLRKHNIEYQSKRVTGRLKPLKVRALRRGTADVVKAAYVACGQREGQLKPPALGYREDMPVRLDDHACKGEITCS